MVWGIKTGSDAMTSSAQLSFFEGETSTVGWPVSGGSGGDKICGIAMDLQRKVNSGGFELKMISWWQTDGIGLNSRVTG